MSHDGARPRVLDPAPVTELIGYARVSTSEQDPALQLDALNGVGCARVFYRSG